MIPLSAGAEQTAVERDRRMPAPTDIAEGDAGAPSSPRSVLAGDLACVSCDYNLRSQPVDGRCPECATAVEYSLRVIPQAADVARGLRRIQVGLSIWLAGALTVVGYPLAALVARVFLLAGERRFFDWYRRNLRGDIDLCATGAMAVGLSAATLSAMVVFGQPWGFVAGVPLLALGELFALANWISLLSACGELADAAGAPRAARMFERMARWVAVCGWGAIPASAAIVPLIFAGAPGWLLIVPVIVAMLVMLSIVGIQIVLTHRLRKRLERAMPEVVEDRTKDEV